MPRRPSTSRHLQTWSRWRELMAKLTVSLPSCTVLRAPDTLGVEASRGRFGHSQGLRTRGRRPRTSAGKRRPMTRRGTRAP
jgi:hypothetical protein